MEVKKYSEIVQWQNGTLIQFINPANNQDLNIVISVKFHYEQCVLKLQNNSPKMEGRMFAFVGFEATFEQLLSNSVNTSRSNWSVSWLWSYPVWPSCYFSRSIQRIVLILKKQKETFISGSSIFYLPGQHWQLFIFCLSELIGWQLSCMWWMLGDLWLLQLRQFLSHPNKKIFTISLDP